MSNWKEEFLDKCLALLGIGAASLAAGLKGLAAGVYRARRPIIVLALLAAAGHSIYKHPPLQTVGGGEAGIVLNRLTGKYSQAGEGAVVVIPGLQELRRIPVRDQVYRPAAAISASGEAPFQSAEGLSLGVDISIRYAFDPARLIAMSRGLPENIGDELVEPIVQGVLYKTFARYTVREIFSTKRQEIQQVIEAELKSRLMADGVVLQSVIMGKVDLPQDYKAGMEKLLAEELAAEKMRFTLELKEKQVQQSSLESEAEKVRREKAAEAAGEEVIIAAKAQAEAMKHVLPFKQKQIEQRGLEAEAEKLTRIKGAEANAEARRIEAAGEADSRQKLADAEVYRQQRIGNVASEQLARDGALLSQHPLLIQKAMADKLSDKISVIIAPPPADGGFIGSALLGKTAPPPVQAVPAALTVQDATEEE